MEPSDSVLACFKPEQLLRGGKVRVRVQRGAQNPFRASYRDRPSGEELAWRPEPVLGPFDARGTDK